MNIEYPTLLIPLLSYTNRHVFEVFQFSTISLKDLKITHSHTYVTQNARFVAILSIYFTKINAACCLCM